MPIPTSAPVPPSTMPPASDETPAAHPIDRVVPVVGRGFDSLVARPGLLLAVCFALNAVFLPYTGIYHDARLYSAQVVQAGTGRFSEDLFFKYGSQSQFTLFPELLAVPVGWVGVEPVFFVVYLAANLLRLWATQRLALRLFGATPAVAAGLVLAAITSGWWGQTTAFAVNEPFLTARLPAFALAALGLESLAAGRRGATIGLLAAAAIVHPLIAAPAIGVALGAVALGWANTRGRLIALALVLILGSAAGTYYTLTAGTLDAEWRHLALARSGHMDPRNWWSIDLVRVVVGVICLAALAAGSQGMTRRIGWAVVGVAVAGVIGGVIACSGTWALLFQVQPVRGAWPLELLRLPAGLALAARLWAGGTGARCAAIAVVAALLAGPAVLVLGVGLGAVAAVGLGALAVRVFTKGRPGWAWRGAVLGLVGWGAAWYVAVAIGEVQILSEDGVYRFLTGAELITLTQVRLSPAVPAAAAVLAVVGLGRWLTIPRAVIVGLAASLAAYFLPSVEKSVGRPCHHPAEVELVRAELDRRWTGPGTPTLYWPGARIEEIWLGLRANSYYHPAQLAGNLFDRRTAIEGHRRWGVVHRFEVERLRREFGRRPEFGGEALGDLIEEPSPTAADLRAVAADPAVDFIVYWEHFPECDPVATNGRVYLYDARRLRSR